MAKKPAKRTSPKPAKTPGKSSASGKSKASGKVGAIEKVNEDILKKLIALNLAPGLQGEIQWCLGSFRFDKNPSGLYLMAAQALEVLKAAALTNGKSVPAKLLSDIEKALKDR